MPLQVRRGTNAQRQAMTEPLASGELLYTTDTGTLYIGNGSTLGGVAVANLSSQDVRDLSASLFTTGTHSGISFDYDSEAGTIDAIVDPDLSNYQGVIRASAFSGSLVADDSGLLVDALNSSINLDGTVKGDIVPDQSEAYDIGSSTRKFKDLYLSGTTLYLGDASITATGTAINLPSGSTVGGVAIGTGSEIVGSGVVEGSNYAINIISDDSGMLLNSSTGEHFGLFKGSFFGEDSTQIIDGHSGVVTGTFQGNLIGSVDGSLTGNITATGTLTGNLIGTVTGNLIGNVNGNVFGDLFGDVEGNTTGFHNGDTKGSLFGNNSSMIIDGEDGSAYLNNVELSTITAPSGINISAATQVRLDVSTKSTFRASGIITDGAFGNAPQIDLHGIRGTYSSPAVAQPGDYTSELRFTVYDGVADIGKSLASFSAQMDPSADETDDGPASNLLLVVSSGDGAGFGGENSFPFLFSYFGSFRSRLIHVNPLEAGDISSITPEAGMIIYNDATDKFQGYVNDTGAGSPGWVDLH